MEIKTHRYPFLAQALSALFLVCALAGCDPSSDVAILTDLRIDTKRPVVSESIDIEAQFEVDFITTGVPDDAEVAIRLPAQLTYERDSGEIYDGGLLDSSDDIDGEFVLNCEDGSSVVVFSLPTGRLIGNGDNSGSVSKQRIKLKAQAVSPGEEILVEGMAASIGEVSRCEDFDSQQDEKITVTLN